MDLTMEFHIINEEHRQDGWLHESTVKKIFPFSFRNTYSNEEYIIISEHDDGIAPPFAFKV